MKKVTVHLRINGLDCWAEQIVDERQWADSGYRLWLVKRLKRWLIDEATAGLEPVVDIEEWDGESLPPSDIGGRWVSHQDLTIGASRVTTATSEDTIPTLPPRPRS